MPLMSLLLVTLLSLLLVVVLMSLLLLLALGLLVLLLALLLFLKLLRGPLRGRLGLYVAQKSATREAGASGFGCDCACGGGGAARGSKGGRVANFSLTAPNLLWRWRWCWRSPRVRHARGWGFALPRSQPRGRLRLYVAQRPATREAGTLGFGCGCGAARGGKGGTTSPSLTAPSLWWLCWCWCCPQARHMGGWDSTLPRGPPRGRLLPRGPPRGKLGL